MSRKVKRESENEDDPEPFEDSGDEWDVEVSLSYYFSFLCSPLFDPYLTANF